MEAVITNISCNLEEGVRQWRLDPCPELPSPRMIWAVTWLSTRDTRWSPLKGLGLWDRGLMPKAMLCTQKLRTLMTLREIWKRVGWLSEAPGDTNDPCGESVGDP